MKPNHFVINLFDVLLLAVLVGGLFRGRSRGMSGELLSLLKWLAVLFGCAAIYLPLGRFVAQSGLFGLVSACVIVYLGAAVLILLGISMAEGRLRDKLVSAGIFGGAEYRLGMVAGMVRYGCILLVGLALLNARPFSPERVKASEASQEATFGSQLFPTLPSVQAQVFERSLTGPWIKQYLGFLLISPT